MKRKYTKKQILESIKYWKKQLNESSNTYSEQSVNDILNEIADFATELDNIENLPFDSYEIIGRVYTIRDMLGLER